VYICTSPLHHYDNCVLEKFEWVEQHLGREFTSRLILSRDKTLVHGDVLVDDNPSVTGVRTPTWRHVVFHQNYNRTVMGPRMTWQSWREVLLGEAPGSTSAKA
jgi:5'-nucleotidase